MKLRSLALALTLMFSTSCVLAADPGGTFAVKGIGLSKCSVFVEVAKGSDKAALSRYVGWIEGFITAGNQYVANTFDLAPWQNIRTLTVVLVNHCDRNADMRFGEAVARMSAALHSDRLTEKSELLPIEHDGQTDYVYQETVRRAQAKLSELGLYTGDIDGQFGDVTTQALKTFQSEHEMDATGLPDQKTLFELLRKRQ